MAQHPSLPVYRYSARAGGASWTEDHRLIISWQTLGCSPRLRPPTAAVHRRRARGVPVCRRAHRSLRVPHNFRCSQHRRHCHHRMVHPRQRLACSLQWTLLVDRLWHHYHPHLICCLLRYQRYTIHHHTRRSTCQLLSMLLAPVAPHSLVLQPSCCLFWPLFWPRVERMHEKTMVRKTLLLSRQHLRRQTWPEPQIIARGHRASETPR